MKLGWKADLNHQFAPHHAKGMVPARAAGEERRHVAGLPRPKVLSRQHIGAPSRRHAVTGMN